jgi:hypothetical protein
MDQKMLHLQFILEQYAQGVATFMSLNGRADEFIRTYDKNDEAERLLFGLLYFAPVGPDFWWFAPNRFVHMFKQGFYSDLCKVINLLDNMECDLGSHSDFCNAIILLENMNIDEAVCNGTKRNITIENCLKQLGIGADGALVVREWMRKQSSA